MKLADKARAIRATLIERKRLRSPAQLRYAIADGIGMLDATAWDALTRDAGFFLSRDYLSGLEAVLPGNLKPRYALIFDEVNQPLAALHMQLAEISLAQVRPRPAGKHQHAKALEQLAERARQRVLVCGNLLTYGQHGVAFSDHVYTQLAWHGVAEVLYRVRKADTLRGDTHFVMIKDLHEPFTQSAACLTHLSYRSVETEPNMVLTLDAK